MIGKRWKQIPPIGIGVALVMASHSAGAMVYPLRNRKLKIRALR